MTKGLFFAAFVWASIWVNPADADQIFATPSGALEPITDQSVSASADFSLTGNTLTIALSDTLVGIQDAGQLLTDVFFTLSASASPSLSSQSGDLVSINVDKKTKVQTVTDLGTSALGWGFGAATVSSLNGFELCVICQGGPTAVATPSEGILGPSSLDGNYDNANGSIAGNKPHNPFVNQTATFTITDVPSGATVDNVIFSFSTTAGDNVQGSATSVVPEPASILLLGTVLMGLSRLAAKLKP